MQTTTEGGGIFLVMIFWWLDSAKGKGRSAKSLHYLASEFVNLVTVGHIKGSWRRRHSLTKQLMFCTRPISWRWRNDVFMILRMPLLEPMSSKSRERVVISGCRWIHCISLVAEVVLVPRRNQMILPSHLNVRLLKIKLQKWRRESLTWRTT